MHRRSSLRSFLALLLLVALELVAVGARAQLSWSSAEPVRATVAPR
jgi:hypothetical protein